MYFKEIFKQTLNENKIIKVTKSHDQDPDTIHDVLCENCGTYFDFVNENFKRGIIICPICKAKIEVEQDKTGFHFNYLW